MASLDRGTARLGAARLSGGRLSGGHRGTGRRWLARARRAFLVTAVAASVAGCVGMPNSGSPGTFSATPQDTTPDSDFIGAIPAGPGASWSPTQVVQGFLNASASYPVYSAIAKEYLASAASKAWNPGWSVEVVDQVRVPPQAVMSRDGRQAAVEVTGKVRASFNGTGQYVGAQQSRGGGSEANWPFNLVKVDRHWRITNPPPRFRMLTGPEFAKVYKPQDLYFFDSTGQVLVPDAVFVPTGTSPASLVSNLVEALLKNPQSGWLQSDVNPIPPAITELPGETRINVAVDGTTATVNLSGAAVAATSTTVREQISAQLVWTLTGQQPGPPNIQAVQLEINGKPWIPPNPPCPGGQSQSPAQKLAMYSCKNPYPPANSQAFYYVDNGQAWSRCASESQVTTGSIGMVLPVFSRTSAAMLSQSCKSSVLASSPAVPPAQPRGLPRLSMIAVSPDSKYAAGVSPGRNAVDVWAAGGIKPASTLAASGVTAIGWDRRDYLWITQGDSTSAVVQVGNGSHEISNLFGGKISGLSIAPDGVRVAAIVQTGNDGPELQLAAIDSGAPASASGQLTSPLAHTSIGPAVQLGPNVNNPIALTWYDADDLLVLDGTANGTMLWEVPVDGQPATKLPGVLPGAISITANSAQNALVVGLTGGYMEVSASLEGPWQPLGSRGQNPAFQVPVSPATAQS
jgi:hypothetical protein